MAFTGFTTDLDGQQVLRNSHDEPNQAMRVNVIADSTTPTQENVVATAFVDSSSIQANSGSYFEVLTSAPQALKTILAFDTTGFFLSIGIGAAGVETEECILAPGNDQPVQVNIPAGTRVSIRSRETPAPTAGSVAFNFIG